MRHTVDLTSARLGYVPLKADRPTDLRVPALKPFTPQVMRLYLPASGVVLSHDR